MLSWRLQADQTEEREKATMLLGCIADDFTGASDLANTLAKAGMRTIQFVGAPKGGAADCDAGVVSLKTRSIPVAEAVRQSLEALEALQKAGCRQILFKYCSTFDSTKEGNIGPVADALIAALGAGTAIVCPAFPTNARTVYKGHLFVGDKPLNESGMENHPLTPMTDANLVRWLGYQSKHKVGLITAETVAKGAEAVRAALEEAAAREEKLVVCDAIFDADLLVLGHAASGMALVTGGSGIAMGLPDNFRASGAIGATPPAPPAPGGRAVAFAGSCSIATRRQVTYHARHEPSLLVDAEEVLAGEQTVDATARWVLHQPDGALPLVYSSADPEIVRALQGRHGTERMAHAVEDFFARLAEHLVRHGTHRIIVAGGETSSAVVSALGGAPMRIGPEIDPGVPVLVTDAAQPLALVLKSGNFGAEDFFLKARATLDRMEPAHV